MNQTESAPPLTISPLLISFMTLQQLVFVISLLGNSLVVYIFVKKLKLKNNTNKFIVSLAIADMLCGTASGMQIFYFFIPEMSNDMFLCFLRYQLIVFTTLVSQMTVTFTTFDRYIAICHPHKYMSVMTTKTTLVLCATTWIVPFIFSILPFVGWHVWQEGIPCLYLILFPRGYYLIPAMTIYLLSFASFVMYISILKVAWRYYSRVKPVESLNRNEATKNKTMERDVRGAKVTGIVTLAFTICWIPFLAFPFQKGIGIDYMTETTFTVMNWFVFLGLFNSIVNPFIYAWKRRDFTKHCKQMFCCLKPEQEDVNTTNVSTAVN